MCDRHIQTYQLQVGLDYTKRRIPVERDECGAAGPDALSGGQEERPPASHFRRLTGLQFSSTVINM